MNSQQFVKVFLNELLSLYVSPVKSTHNQFVKVLLISHLAICQHFPIKLLGYHLITIPTGLDYWTELFSFFG